MNNAIADRSTPPPGYEVRSLGTSIGEDSHAALDRARTVWSDAADVRYAFRSGARWIFWVRP